jgi:hypothetical protein
MLEGSADAEALQKYKYWHLIPALPARRQRGCSGPCWVPWRTLPKALQKYKYWHLRHYKSTNTDIWYLHCLLKGSADAEAPAGCVHVGCRRRVWWKRWGWRLRHLSLVLSVIYICNIYIYAIYIYIYIYIYTYKVGVTSVATLYLSLSVSVCLCLSLSLYIYTYIWEWGDVCGNSLSLTLYIVCMYVCIYVCMYVCMYIYIYIYIYI